jgi:hypothetical protein
MKLTLSFLLLLLTVMSGCFPGDGQQRTIIGDYKLHQWEDGITYYLHKQGQDDSSQGGSIIGGTVLRIGWNSRYIVAERHSIFRGDADGWMIIDVQSGVISGPFSDSDFRARPEVKDIQIYDASEAWGKL